MAGRAKLLLSRFPSEHATHVPLPRHCLTPGADHTHPAQFIVQVVGVGDDISLPAHGDDLTGQVKGDIRWPLFIGIRAIPHRIVGERYGLRPWARVKVRRDTIQRIACLVRLVNG